MLTFLESSCIKGKLDVILQFKKAFFYVRLSSKMFIRMVLPFVQVIFQSYNKNINVKFSINSLNRFRPDLSLCVNLKCSCSSPVLLRLFF